MGVKNRHINALMTPRDVMRELGYVLYLDIAIVLLLITETVEVFTYSLTSFWIGLHIFNDILGSLIVLLFIFGKKHSFMDEPFKGTGTVWKRKLYFFVFVGLGLRTLFLPLGEGLVFTIIFGTVFYSLSISLLRFQWKVINIRNVYANNGKV